MRRAPTVIGGMIVVAAVASIALVACRGDPVAARGQLPPPAGGAVEHDTLGQAQDPQAQGQVPQPTAGNAADDPLKQDQDREARSLLLNAIVGAKTYHIDGNTYSGWDSTTAAEIDSYLVWADDVPATVGRISINYAHRDEVVMSTLSESGQAFCIAEDSGSSADEIWGSIDAHGATGSKACSGGS